MTDTLDHAALLALSKELNRPLYTLKVLGNDPFTAGAPARKAGAEWFAKLWDNRAALGAPVKIHLHGFHYILVSQPTPVLMPNGEGYENTQACEDTLLRCSLGARYLGLVPPTDFDDRRNEEPIINNTASAAEGWIGTYKNELAEIQLPDLEIPKLEVEAPVLLQRYSIIVCIEKSTQDKTLKPLCERLGIDLIRGIGELSLTRCVQIVEQAIRTGRPVRILYISDFDPAGASMPVAVARKVEHLLYQQGIDLDIQLRPIALTYEQCNRYCLPRTPLKETEARAANFEARFGEGATTELDALEALRPGELERILMQEIDRYYDHDLQGNIDAVVDEAQVELDEITEKVHDEHAEAIAELKNERKKLQAAIKAFEKKAKPIFAKVEEALAAEALDADDYDWPEPGEGDEDDDPLFDSTREYVEQINRYKEHQGKPTSMPKKSYSRSFTRPTTGDTRRTRK